MKNFKVKNFLTLAFMLVMLIFIGEAEAGIITDRLPFQCYVDHQVDTYNQPNGQKVGYISANVDLIRVTQVRGDGWAYGDYPGRNGRVARWFRITDICADPSYSNRGVDVKGSYQVYRTKNDSNTIGSISNENVIVLADNGNRAQIIYRLNNGTGYKVGWVPSSVVNSRPSPSSTLKGDVNGDGKVDQSDLELMKKYMVDLVSESQINKTNADINGDGTINAVDLAMLSDKVNNQPKIPSNLQNLINTYKDKTWRDHTYLPKVKQCKEFASFIFNKLYDVGYIGGGSTSDNPKNYLINLTNPSRVALRGYKTNLTAQSARELFQSAQPGDFVQIRRRHGGPHSGIFVNRTNDGIVLFEANEDGKNSIRTNTYSYNDLANRNFAMSLYYAK